MGARDALFEDIQAISDDAEALGLQDVSLVLESALDVFLRDTGMQSPLETTVADGLDTAPPRELCLGWSMSNFPLGNTHRKAS
jgi:hypothetical protein